MKLKLLFSCTHLNGPVQLTNVIITVKPDVNEKEVTFVLVKTKCMS